MKKKIVSVLLCAAMVAGLAVGCGGKDGGDGGDKGGDKLVYWSMWSEEEPQAKVIKEAVEKYTEDTGVKVDVQFKGRNGQREGLQPALGKLYLLMESVRPEVERSMGGPSTWICGGMDGAGPRAAGSAE